MTRTSRVMTMKGFGGWRCDAGYAPRFHAYPSPNVTSLAKPKPRRLSPSLRSGRSALEKVHRTFSFARANRVSPLRGRVGRCVNAAGDR